MCIRDRYISLDTLYEEGLLKERPEGFHEYATKVDYDAVRLHKEPYLREAFQTFLIVRNFSHTFLYVVSSSSSGAKNSAGVISK